jgi:hypothetical protein
MSMAQSRDESPSRIELVVLGCLSQGKPPNDAELGEAMQQLALPRESAEAARRRATDLLAGLVRRGWATGDDLVPARTGRSKTSGPRQLTDSGKRALRNAFQLERTPTWPQIRDKHFPSMAIGVKPGAGITKKACTETGLMAAVLGARFGVRDAWTPLAVCDALIAKALGMPAGKLTLERIRAHVIGHGIDRHAKDAPSSGSKGYGGKFAAWVACSTVDATGTQRKMARTLARRWVCAEPHPLGLPVAGDGIGRDVPAVVAAPLPPSTETATFSTGNGGTVGNGNPAENGNTRTPASNGGLRTTGPVGANGPRRPGTTDGGPQLTPPNSTGEGNRITVSENRNPPPAPKDLLDAVLYAIGRIGAEGRFGEKVYVSAIWRAIERERMASGLSLDHFKRWLVGANRDRLLVLARADLIGAMDAKQVSESEIKDRGATFHFVLDQRNGVSPLLRESHAR